MKYKNIDIYTLALLNSAIWIAGIDFNNLSILKIIGLVTTLIMILVIFKSLIHVEDVKNVEPGKEKR